MKVYELDSDATGKWISFFTLNSLAIGDYSKSRSLFDSGVAIKLCRNPEMATLESSAKLADFSNVNYAPYPCFSDRAKSVLSPYLDGLGKWLRADFEEVRYWLFYITNIVDVIDENSSKISYFTDGGVMSIDEFSIRPRVVKGQLMFKVIQRPGPYSLVTQDFVDLVTEHHLTGFSFRLLWTSEGGPVSSKLKDYERPRITGLER